MPTCLLWHHNSHSIQPVDSQGYPLISSTRCTCYLHWCISPLTAWLGSICYMCIYIYIYMCVCVCVYLFIYIYVCVCVYMYICLYIYFGIMVRVFANGPRAWSSILGQVLPNTQNIVLDASLLNSQHYKVCIKGIVEQSGKMSCSLSYSV